MNESSALTIACECNIDNCNDELIKLLIDYGADINQTTFKNKNAIVLLIEKNNSKMISFLIDNGANFDNIDSILQNGHIENIELIMKCYRLSSSIIEIKEVQEQSKRKRGPVHGLYLL